MNTVQTVLAAHRAHVVEMRASYHETLRGRTFKVLRKDRSSHEQATRIQSQLTYLVPLYRTMEVAAQHSLVGITKGAETYAKQYAALRRRIKNALINYTSSDRDTYFNDRIEELPVLVPSVEVPFQEWASVTIKQLFKDVLDEILAERQEEQVRFRQAEAARQSFLNSLTAEQVTLLEQALTKSKAVNRHAIQIFAQDIPSKAPSPSAK